MKSLRDQLEKSERRHVALDEQVMLDVFYWMLRRNVL